MAKAQAELTLEEELMILMFWAHGADIMQKFSEERLRVVPGLTKAIEEVYKLPGVLGWGQIEARQKISSSKNAKEQSKVRR